MEIAISSASPLPRGGFLTGAASPAVAGFGDMLRTGDSSPPNRADAIMAGPSGRPAQGSQTETNGDPGPTAGATTQLLPPVLPPTGGQPPIQGTQPTLPNPSTKGNGPPLSLALSRTDTGVMHFDAPVVAAGLRGSFDAASPPAVGTFGDRQTLEGSQTHNGSEVQRTDATVVAFRVDPPSGGSTADAVQRGILDQPSVGGGGAGDGEVGHVRGSTESAAKPPGTEAERSQPSGSEKTQETSSKQVGSSEVQHSKARVVAAAVLGLSGLKDVGGQQKGTGVGSGGTGGTEPPAGNGNTQFDGRVIGRPIAGPPPEQTQQRGLPPAPHNDDLVPPREVPGGQAQRHDAEVVAAGTRPPARGDADEGLTTTRDPNGWPQSTQLGGAGTSDGATVTPMAYGVRVRPEGMTTVEVSDRSIGASAEMAASTTDQATRVLRPAPTASAVAAYGGSEVRAPAQPFPRLDIRF